MTYFEWVETFKKLETSPMDDELLKQLEDKTLDGNDYVLYHLITHVITTINKRINNAFGIILKKIVSGDLDINLLELELVEFKKEINFSKRITKLSIIPLENQEVFEESIDNTVNDMYDIFKRRLEYIDVNGEYISILEKNKY